MQDPDQTPSGDAPRTDPTSTGDVTPPPSSAPDPTPPPPPPAATPPPAAVTTSAPPPAYPPPAAPSAQTGRPTGITILAILAAIGGVLSILGGLALLVSGGFIGVATGSGALGGLAALIGAITLISGVLSLLFAWGAWGLQPWAWTLGVVLMAVNIVLGLYQLISGNTGSLLSIAIAAAITYYLFRPEIRAAFGRA